MVRLVSMCVLIALLSGCKLFPVRVEVIEVYRPVLYCPAPNWEELHRPDPLAIDAITNDTTDGEVALRYRATIIQLMGYSKRLEKALERYDHTSAAYEDLRKEFVEQRKREGIKLEN
jgi:hypothetical protein